MKSKLLIAIFSLSLMSFSSTASAADACEVVLCMFGKLMGKSQKECRAAEREYFSINIMKKGKFKPSETVKARMNLLNQCPSPENGKINSAFGKLRG